MRCVEIGSSAEAGSSSSRISGRIAIARAMPAARRPRLGAVEHPRHVPRELAALGGRVRQQVERAPPRLGLCARVRRAQHGGAEGERRGVQ
ncbi:MAG: hypothetical protein ABR585_15635, partial [Gemmatimonadaceae bacterium]